MALDEWALEFEGFKLGDCVDSFGCETGRPYMPGVGIILAIKPREERPFICEHGDRVYRYKKAEISISE